MAGGPSASKVAVVTGAASGIGRATSDLLCANGWRVAAWDIGAVEGGRDGVLELTVDVRDEASVVDAADATLVRLGRIDLVVNAAGLFLRGALSDVRAEAVGNLFAVNVLGPSLVTRACLTALVESGGAVVNLASSVATKATPSNSHYAASKAAVMQLTRCWALELAPHGVRVNAVAPGPTDTAIYASAGMTEQEIDTLLRGRASTIPLGRTGKPDEIATWILRLGAADEWVTGQVLAVDGGMAIS